MFAIHFAALVVMVAGSCSPLVIRCGAAVYNFNDASSVGTLLDALIERNLLVPVAASTDHQVLHEQEKTLSVVETCLGPNRGISDVKTTLEDAGYGELSAQISQLHCKRKGVAHPHVGLAERLKAALHKIGERHEGLKGSDDSQCSKTQHHVLVLDELIRIGQECTSHARNSQNAHQGIHATSNGNGLCFAQGFAGAVVHDPSLAFLAHDPWLGRCLGGSRNTCRDAPSNAWNKYTGVSANEFEEARHENDKHVTQKHVNGKERSGYEKHENGHDES